MAGTNDDTRVVGRYARYKAGQQVVVTWLAVTASQYRDLATYLAANQELAVLSLAHFYKAAQHYGLITVQWHDMEFVIAQHSTKKSFVTKTASTSGPYAWLNHYLIDLGVEASAFTGGRVPSPPSPATVMSKCKKLATADSGFRAALGARLAADRKLGVFRGSPYDAVLTQMTEAAQAASKPTNQSHRARFGPTDLLATLKKDLIADEPRMNFNYIEFTTFCLTLMRKIFDITTSQMLKRESQGLKCYYEVVYSLMKGAADARASSKPVANTSFGQAAAAMQSVLADGDAAKKFSQAAFDQSSGRIPKTKRPSFPAKDIEVKAAIDEIASMLPKASIGSSRQTIEIYDPTGSVETFQRLVNSGASKKLNKAR